MSDIGKQMTFKQLLDRHGRVEVPLIQRDYAQGREAETDVRNQFLDVLFKALTAKEGDPTLPLNLDFIYGSVEGDSTRRFLPLDGQQRLTTLFLLDWYAAWKDGSTDEFQKLFCDQRVSRFSYRVRPSSSDFFDALVNFKPKSPPTAVPDLGELMKDQAWYFRQWRMDPTIQSALGMLDSIHKKFQYCEGMFSRLLDEDQPAITFLLLEDSDFFRLTDDLYIKMNSRGKPLTPFEAFKASYEQALQGLYGDETRPIDGRDLPVAEFFSHRMDTAWADFFWARTKNLFDDEVMNLIRNVILISRAPGSETYSKVVEELRSKSLKCSYTSFYNEKWIDRDFSDTLLMLLETWSNKGLQFECHLPDERYFKKGCIFKTFVSKTSDLTYAEIVQLEAYVSFLKEHEGDDIDSIAFQNWMRIAYNLSINTDYNRAEDLMRSVSGIRKMLDRLGDSDSLEYFAKDEKPISGFSIQQIREEQIKAQLILLDDKWRELIVEAEAHGYFDGQIEFLLDFADVLERLKQDSGEFKLTDEEHADFQERFKRNLNLAQIMFSDEGLKIEDKQCLWERALLSFGDYLLPSKGHDENFSFLVNDKAEQGSWKRLLRGEGSNQQREILKKLWRELSPSAPIYPQLKSIIQNAGNLELHPWRKAFIVYPEAINYCSQRLIRYYKANHVYLLQTTQMKGWHAELFTYCLYKEMEVGRFTDDLRFLSVKDDSYSYSRSGSYQPGILLECKINEQSCMFKLECTTGDKKEDEVMFLISEESKENEKFPDFVDWLIKFTKFEKGEDRVQRPCKKEEVREELIDLDRAIADYHGNQTNRG